MEQKSKPNTKTPTPKSNSLKQTSEDNKIANAPYIKQDDVEDIKKDMPAPRNVGRNT